MKNIEIIARAIVIENGRILLCRAKEADWDYFPGGHVEFGEEAAIALNREFIEELGTGAKNMRLVSTLENIFTAKMFEDEEARAHHEIILIYNAELENYADKSLENHIDFEWVDFSTFKNRKILPEGMKEIALDLFERVIGIP